MTDSAGRAEESPSGSGPTGAGVAALIRVVANELARHRDALNRLDGVAGDGDLGLTVSTAAQALLELAPSLETMSEGAAIRAAGMELARRAPSTGGTLIAFALLAASKAPVDPSASALERAAGYVDVAAKTVAQRGQVDRGDRTMLDALGPAAEALRAAVEAGAEVPTALHSAATAADEGARATSTMAAKVGRAGWLAERAAGSEDAGARLVALAFGALVQRA